jgi:hypothetical protein
MSDRHFYIFFIFLADRLIYITVNSHFRNVQTSFFICSGDANRCDLIGDLEEEVHNGEDEDETGKGSYYLGAELAGISIKKAFYCSGNAVPSVSIGAIGE